MRVKNYDNRSYNKSVAGTVSGSDGKGSKYMFSRIGTVIGWMLLAIMSTAFGAWMVIAVANSTPMM